MTEVQLRTLRVSAELDASAYTAGMNEKIAADRAGAASSTQVAQKINQTASSFERVKRQFIDGYGAAARMESALNMISKGLDRGAFSAEEAARAADGVIRRFGIIANAADYAARGQLDYARAIEQANARLGQQVTLSQRAQTMGARTPVNDNFNSADASRRQNLGYQLFDIGQSTAMGMSPAMILAQQGPQIAQLYAMQGGLNAAMRDFMAILGGVARVAGPVIGVLAGLYGGYKILESYSVAAGLAVSESTRALADQAAPISALKGQIGELTQLQGEYNKVLAQSAVTMDSSLALALANTQREYDARKALLDLELLLQEAKLRTMQADIALAGQAMRERIASQVMTEPGRALRDGFADPAINGGNPFVRLPDDISGLQKTIDTLNADPATTEIAKMRAELTLAQLTYEKLREALSRPLDISGSAISSANAIANQRGPLINDPDYLDYLSRQRNSGRPQPLPAPEPRVGALDQSVAGSRADIAGQVQARQQLFQAQNEEIEKLRLEAQLVGASARERATMTAALQAEQQLRQQGIDILSAEGQAYKANAVAMAQARLEIERQNAAYSSLQSAGGSAIDSLTVGTGSLKDRLKAAADTMLQWIQQLTIANPLKNALFGTNLPTMADLFSGRPSMPGATSTASMMVTAGTVMINGGITGGSFPGVTSPGTTTGGGLLDILKAPAAANVNGVRPDLIAGGIVNSPVAANTNLPAGSIEAYIRNAAIQRGIDPNVAVRVAQSEGGLTSWNAQSQVFKNGVQEPSFGPYQLYMGGGLGNRFQSATGLDPRLAANGPAGVDFALDTASKEGWGAWYGARKAGISDWQGIGRNPGIDTGATNSIQQSNAALKQFSSNTLSASKDVSSLGDSTLKLGTDLTDSLGKIPASVPAVTPPVPATQTVTGGGNIFSSLFGGFFKLFGFADGTDNAPGGLAWVGERGRELVNLPRGSQVIPTHKVSQMGRSSGGGGGRTRVDVGVTVDRNGNLEAYVKGISQQTSQETTRQGIAEYDAVAPDRWAEWQRNPDFRGAA